METKTAEQTFATYFEGNKPIERTDTWRLSDGTRIVLRPVQPQDGPLLSAMMARLSSQTKYNRFHGTVNNLTSTHLRYMSCVDQQRHVAFVLTTLQNGEEHIIADARYVVDENTADESAEFAIMVEDEWQRLGLAKHAMHALTTAALNNGLRWLRGDILTENYSMLALMEQCHFCCTQDRSNEKMVHAEILLTTIQNQSKVFSNTLWHYFVRRIQSVKNFVQPRLNGGRYA